MAEPKTYSERLGAISEEQFAAALARLDLGAFVSAAPTTSGLFGQNVFLTSAKGEFVLRGAPHWVRGPNDGAYRPQDRWQFTKEGYFVDALHEKTNTPVPWPYLRDEASDIFGWPYAIMPRMPGDCFSDRSILKALPEEDRAGVAQALGAMLVEMQTLTSPFAGDLDVDTIELTPYPGGGTRRVVDEMTKIAAESAALMDADHAWMARIARDALAAPTPANTYRHVDYKLNNLTVLKDESGWRVSGLFDFHEASFGDGALDLVRQACAYLDTQPPLARVFIDAYRARAPRREDLDALMPLYVVNDRLKIWDYFKRPGAPPLLPKDETFREWAGRYHDAVLSLVG